MRFLPTATIALALVVPAPALAAKTHTTNLAYRVTQAQGIETVTFQGDGTSACANAGLCGYSGTATYSFNTPRRGFAVLTIERRGHRQAGLGDVEFGIDGTTTSNVSQAGVAQPCVDSVKHRFDSLDSVVSGSRALFGLHAFNASDLASDYLGSHCAGPTEGDMVAGQVLPSVVLPLSAMRKSRVHFELHSDLPFHVGPFTGRLKVDAAYTFKRDRKAERRLNK